MKGYHFAKNSFLVELTFKESLLFVNCSSSPPLVASGQYKADLNWCV